MERVDVDELRGYIVEEPKLLDRAYQQRAKPPLLLQFSGHTMDPRLQQAIEHDDVDELHSFIVEEPKLLDHACKDPFPNTPLHVAAAAGKTQVAIEMAIMEPSFARKLNPEAYSPMHLALQHEHYQTARALMKFDPELVRVRGRHGMTPLHYLAAKGGDNELELLAEFLVDCKSSIKDLTSQCETAVHVAVKNHNLEAFKVLLGWLKRFSLIEILDRKDQDDQDGNTALHTAVLVVRAFVIIKLLIRYTNVDLKNFQDKTALEIFQANSSGDQDVRKRLCRQKLIRRVLTPTLSLSRFYSRELYANERIRILFGISSDRLNKTLVLTCFLLAAAFCGQAATSVEGLWRHSFSNSPANSTVVTINSSSTAIGKPHQAGNLMLNGWPLYVKVGIDILFYVVSLIIANVLCLAVRLPYAPIVYWCICGVSYGFFMGFRTELPEPIEVAGASFWNFTSTRG
ncbi:hypothetical protein BT93_D0005 [Corymbia citriodora subsp. variegata]|nr:hypothetical protein BT93_D0005 [Corymbia citriodora subsp. variegata]